MNKKILLISHIADPDGITPVILAKQVYKQVDTILTNPGEVDKYLEENLDKYETIHITDLNISESLAQKLEKQENINKKLTIIDHHISSINLNKYSFITVIDEENNQKQSATSLYYKYLLKETNNEILKKESTKGLVEQVRIIDTYDFKTEKDKGAHNIDALFSILGRENYIEYFTEYIKENDKFKYTEQEKFLIKLEQDKIKNYIEQKEKEIIKAKLDNYKVAIVYAERYRSDLGNYLINKLEDIDFTIIISITKSISYRANGKIDLSVFSKKYGGGGHKNASGSPLPKDLLKNITKQIYNNIEIEEEKNE